MGDKHHLYPSLESFAYLAMVIDVFSRRIIGWSLQSRQMDKGRAAGVLMAVWRQKPKSKVQIHSD